MLQRIMTAATETETARISRTLHAARDVVFRAWTDPEEFKAWWQPRPYTTTAVEMDARVGGGLPRHDAPPRRVSPIPFRRIPSKCGRRSGWR